MQSKSRRIARRALLRIVALTLGAALALVVVPVATSAAAISITEPGEGSTTGPLPSFAGTTELELVPVTVELYQGSSASGTPTPLVALGPSGGLWTAADESPLEAGKYTAIAEQAGEEPSGERHFTVSTKPPAVSLKGPSSPTADTTPAFSGTASETEPVTVKVYRGTKTTGTPEATAEATVKSGNWGPVSSAPALGEGEYTAIASEPSSLGNGEGKSSTVSFRVETKSPTVTLETPPTPSKSRSPSFTGTASAETPVVVEIYAGAKAEGTPVSKATASGTGGAFTTGAASPELATGNHTYTAVATQESPAGLEGTSNEVTFVVDTETPKLNLQTIKARSNVNKPTFRGEVLTEPGTVTVHVYSGKEAKGTEVASYPVDAPEVGVEWKVVASPALPDGVYTAQATEPSAAGNGTGKSETRTFEIDTEPPEVTLKAPPARSDVNEPAFSGTVSEAGRVTVQVYGGKEARGTVAGTYEVTAAAGKWEVTASPALADGTYTAVATEPSGLGNDPGTSESQTFEIDTHAPEVTLEGVPTPSNNTNPSFSGTASETKNVTVRVYKGPTATGSPVATAEGAVSGGHWKTPSLATTLQTGEYTAVAGEPSSIGNGEGHSEPVTFEVDTSSPVVTLATPTTPSNNRTPAFTGTASANTEVVVHIYEGSEAKGTQVATAIATGTEGAWSSAAASPGLLAGKHTYAAIATQASPLGNPEGKSNVVTFVVNTNPPTVTLKAILTPSNDTTPTLEGTATGSRKVAIKIYKGTTATGSPVATAEAEVTSGKWGPVSSTTLPGNGTYTAQAEQESAIGNGPGKSETQTFFVNTSPPEVTLNSIETPSKNQKPSFSGTASESEPVSVEIFEGENAEGTPVQTVPASVTSGSWGPVSASTLKSGTYTAVASEASSLGNKKGQSSPIIFVVDTTSPKVTLNTPASPSNDQTPTFTGTASATTNVVVHIYEGSEAKGTQLASATVKGTGGAFTTGEVGPALPSGKHTFAAQATQESPLGNPEGKSNVVTFVVNTNPPTVTLNAITTPSGNTTPSFSGTASETRGVVVKVYKGSEAKGTPFAITEEAAVASEKWGPASSATPLVEGEYTAVASEPSSLGNGEGKSSAIKFVVITKPPTVTLAEVESPSKDTTPSFSGTTTDTTTVTVKVYKGGKAEGPVLETLEATPKSGSFSTAVLKKALGDGLYTAVATEPSSLGNPAGTSNAVTFDVDTAPPTVTLNTVLTPSSDTTPSFSGTASESEQVTVDIYKGAKAEGTVVTSATAEVSSRNWSTSALAKPLASGEYTAQAVEPSSIGNGPGKSEPRTFVVNTKPPEVTLAAVLTPSNDTTPSFSGTASESNPVTVKIYAGSKAEGSPLESVEAPVSGGKWGSVNASPALTSGTYTAIAEENSSLGNGFGKSETRTFVINTEPPEVTLNSVTSPSNNTKPSFSGTASESNPVTVKIYKNSKAEGPVVATAEGTVKTGKWGPVTSSTELTGGTYTAVAEEVSSLGNPTGKSETRTFVVNTNAPEVTLNAVPTPSNDTTPSFSGTASELLPVTVKVYKGTEAKGSVVATAEASVLLGKWGPASSSPALGSGIYTAVAEEASTLGNPTGKSEPRTFVVNTKPPEVTLAAVLTPSNDTTPSFSGTASESNPVTVKIYAGSKAEGSLVATAEGSVKAGNWGPASSSTVLTSGTYTAVAEENSSLGNGFGKSETRTFVINTVPPEVTLAAVPTPSNNVKPAFSGTAGETLPVTVKIYKGTEAKGSPVATAEGTVKTGKWGSVSSSTPLITGTYTAVAEEESSLGNPNGKSEPRTFAINTEPPEVTLAAVPTPSNDTTPSFSGTASESNAVTVKVYKGTEAKGSPVASAEGSVSGGKWGPVSSSPELKSGTYTAVAEENSSLGNGFGKSETRTFVVNTEPPEVTLTPIKSRSKVTKPTFHVKVSEAGTVTVHVYPGKEAKGTETAKYTVTATAPGDWEVVASPALADGTYTAIATEPSALGNNEGKSETRTFEVDTEPPEVTLNPVTTPSDNTKPAFSGTASESLPVTVKIYSGSKAEGSLVATAEGPVSGDKWGAVSSSTTLTSGTYTAVAVEQSSLENAAGESAPVTFVINTNPPEVTVEAPPARSKESKPTFKGTASEAGTVTVKVFKGTEAKGEEAAKLSATVVEGKWTASVTGTLLDGKYTVQATEPSAIGNGPGSSAADQFEVFTKPPTVTMEAPKERSNESKPTFKGTASEPGQVTVHVFNGKEAKGTETKLTATVGSKGEWSVAPGTALADGTYTAVATEPSAIGNEQGESKPPRTFEVFTGPPTVKITQGPKERSNVKLPTFEGEASETEPVTVHIYEGTGTAGTEVVSMPATVSSEHKWHVTVTSALADGKYTAQATEPSSLGNATGKSEPAQTFEVFSKPPTVTMAPLKERSKENEPTFKGTASEQGVVTVHVFKGKEAKGTEFLKLTATVGSKGEWSVTPTTALPDETYTAVAVEPSAIGNEEGKSEPRTFEIFTKPPTVEIKGGPKARSNVKTPSFEGTASETEAVTVHIHEGSGPGGAVVMSLTATVTEHKWHVTATTGLADGTYTAVASEPSSIGNAPGEGSWPTFEVDTKPPVLECAVPQAKSGNATPSFSGTSNESTVVVVDVYNSESSKRVATLEAHPAAGTGAWSTAHVSPELPDGAYKEVATQDSGIGNAPASCSHEFEVAPVPTVFLSAVESPSKLTTPTFSGTTSEKAPLKVVIYEGLAAEGITAATLEDIQVTGSSCTLKAPCKWSATLTTPLFAGQADHVYTAIAEQKSGIPPGLEGISEPQTFEVDTRPPRVAITPIGPQLGEHQKQPTLSGTATDPKEEVTVRLYKGGEAKGVEVASMKTPVSGGHWGVQVPSALAEGQYTAVATQPSSLKNLPGESLPMTFEVILKSPVVTLKEVPSPTSDAAPSFSGTATDPKEKVTVRVFAGGAPEEGQEVAKVEAEVANGQWSAVSLANEGESLQDGEYTAIAEQPSSLGNKAGKSEPPIHFVVQVQPPTVSEVSASANRTAALMNATVDANGGRLSVCRFEYGATTGYGREAQCAFVVGTAGGDNPGCAFTFPPSTPECEFPLDHGENIFARVNRLSAGTTYFFRIVTENEHGNGNQAMGEGSFRTADAEVVEETPSQQTKTSQTSTNTGPSDSVLAATIVKELAPGGGNASISKLLKNGGYRLGFKLQAGGTAMIGWYYLPKGASLTKRSAKGRKPVLVAAGKATVSASSGATVKIGLTPTGRKLLKSLGKIKLTARCTFTPSGTTTPIVSYQTFTLKR